MCHRTGARRKKVTIIERTDALASGPNAPYPGTGAMQIDALWTNVKKNHVEVMLNTSGVEITDTGMICEDKDGNRLDLKADAVVVAAGIAPNEDVVEKLRDAVIDFAWIGDCYEPGLVRTAVRQAYDAAQNI